jgi:type II secretory pathway pseudopilin PulG
MAALLVAMTIMAIVMTVALPVWHTAARREQEAELIFRGQQYARAVMLYQRRFPGAAPPNLDVLLNEHLLRKKYKDPITNDDFQLVGAADAIALQGAAGAGAPGLTPPGSPPRPGQTTGTGSSSQRPTSTFGSSFGGGGQSATTTSTSTRPGDQIANAFGRPSASAPGTAAGGIMGVVSKSKDTSLRLYNGRNKYNEWVFVATQSSVQAGTGAGGGAAGLGARGRGQQPGPNTPNGPGGFGNRPGGPGQPPNGRFQGPGQTLPPPPGGRQPGRVSPF